MTLIDILAAGLPLTLLVNWPVFAVCFIVARQHPGIRTLIDRRWLSFVIALSTTGLTILVLAYFGGYRLDGNMTALILAAPAYLFTAINAVFVYLTWRGRW